MSLAGETCITFRNQTGMFSIGVVLPDRRFRTTSTGSASRPNCGIEAEELASRIPSAVTENSQMTAPVMNKGIDPAVGTPSSQRTMSERERIAAAKMTSRWPKSWPA